MKETEVEIMKSLENVIDIQAETIRTYQTLFKINRAEIEQLKDRMEVIRCKDCKHGEKGTPAHNGNDILCDFSDWEYSDMDFCSRAERRKE